MCTAQLNNEITVYCSGHAVYRKLTEFTALHKQTQLQKMFALMSFLTMDTLSMSTTPQSYMMKKHLIVPAVINTSKVRHVPTHSLCSLPHDSQCLHARSGLTEVIAQ